MLRNSPNTPMTKEQIQVARACREAKLEGRLYSKLHAGGEL